MQLTMKGKAVRRLECCKYQVYCNGTLCFTWFLRLREAKYLRPTPIRLLHEGRYTSI